MTKPFFAAFETSLSGAQSASATMDVDIGGTVSRAQWWSNTWSGGRHGSSSVMVGARRTFYKNGTVAEAFDALMTELASAGLRPWTLEVTVSPAKAATRDAIRDAMIPAIREALPNVAWPSDEDMQAQRKAFKKAARDKEKASAAERATRKKAQLAAEETRRAAVIADAKADAVGDVAALIEVLGKRLKDPGRLGKTMSMLKKDGFQLFSDVSDTKLEGVVKSQTEADLVYGCRLASDGTYSCCTQNLNVCGGLRGQPCKHLLVLVVGLAQANVLPLASANDWMIATLVHEPKLDREASADVFLKYRSAQAGELDWRPTETTPEDFYSY